MGTGMSGMGAGTGGMGGGANRFQLYLHCSLYARLSMVSCTWVCSNCLRGKTWGSPCEGVRTATHAVGTAAPHAVAI